METKYYKINEMNQIPDKLYTYDEAKDNEYGYALNLPNGYVSMTFSKNEHLRIVKGYLVRNKLKFNEVIFDGNTYIIMKDNKVDINKRFCILGIPVEYENKFIILKNRHCTAEYKENFGWEELDSVPLYFTTTKQEEINILSSTFNKENLMRYFRKISLDIRITKSVLLDITNQIRNIVPWLHIEDSEVIKIFNAADKNRKDELEKHWVQHIKAERNSRGIPGFGDALAKYFHIIFYNKRFYVQTPERQGVYIEDNERYIDEMMRKVDINIQGREKNAVKEYLKDTYIVRHSDMEETDEYMVNLANGRYNIKTGIFEDYPDVPDTINFYRLDNVKYDPEAKSELLEKTFKNILKTEGQYNLFWELVGSGLIHNARFTKGGILYGPGGNGKSVLLEFIQNMIGEGNYSTVSIHDLARRFANADINHKFFNIDDDIGNGMIRDTSNLKKIFTGSSIQVEQKRMDPITIRPTCTQLFSANEFFKTTDKTVGLYRRFVFLKCDVPFNEKACKERGEEFDPFLQDKLSTPENYSAALNLAIDGANRLLKNNGQFTTDQSIEETMRQFKIENNVVLQYLEDLKDTYDTDEKLYHHFTSTSKTSLYDEFVSYYNETGGQKQSMLKRNSFYKELCRELGLDDLKSRKSGKERFFLLTEEKEKEIFPNGEPAELVAEDVAKVSPDAMIVKTVQNKQLDKLKELEEKKKAMELEIERLKLIKTTLEIDNQSLEMDKTYKETVSTLDDDLPYI